MKKTIVYVRVSTLKDEQESSIPHQISQLTDYAEKNGLQVVDIVIDKISGSKTKLHERQGASRLIQLAQENKFDILLAKSVSRIGRDTVENLTLKRILEQNNISIYAINEALDTSKDDDEFLYTLHSSLAQSYSKKLGKDVKAGQIEKAKKGGWNTPFVPYGYKWDGQKLVKNPEEQFTLDLIFNYLLQGYGIRKTAYLINENKQAAIPRKSKQWAANSISHISKNPVYYGAISFAGEIQTEKGLHEAYITKEQFNMIQNFRKPGFNKTGSTPTGLLISVARCGYCGGSVQMLKRKTKNTEYRYYCCHQYTMKGKAACEGFHRRELEVNQFINQWLDETIFSHHQKLLDQLEQMKDELKQNDTSEQIKTLDKEIEKQTKFYMHLTEQLINEQITQEMYDRSIKMIREKEENLKKQKENLIGQATQDIDIDSIKNMIEYGKDYYKWDLEEKRNFLKSFLEVYITKENIDISIKK